VRALVQRVTRASVRVDGQVTGAIGSGLLVLLGATHADGPEEVDWMARKIAGLRIFGDAAGLMNLDVRETGGQALVVPQFTLYGDARRGRRPAFTNAAAPERAEPLFEQFCEALAASGVPVARGVFRAHMEVELVNDGPVTLWIDREAEPPVASPAPEAGT
jgi:D-aminoacyl-tRNA deacylase